MSDSAEAPPSMAMVRRRHPSAHGDNGHGALDESPFDGAADDRLAAAHDLEK